MPGRPALRRHLPDLRNLGVLLRTLLLVNLLALLTALVQEPAPVRLFETFLALAARVELPLFVIVLLYFAAAPMLVRLPWVFGVALLGSATAIVVALLFPLLAMPGDALWRWLLWALAALGATLAYFDHRERSLTPALAEARLMALTARIRPHFLFNALNGVLGTIRSDPRRAERALEELAELFRALMREQHGLVALADELVLCRRYLDIESLRLGDRLQVDWEVGDGVEEARVPPLILQPLIENAIYHGVEHVADASRIGVRIARRGAELRIEVDNPRADAGEVRVGNRIALDNIRERLQLFFDLEASLEAGPRGGRFHVVIRLPYRRSSHGPESAPAHTHR
ncbi:sensor histidine kinase [Pseudazoarcus pumilus]|uniref:Sensor histidine kinase n=2 Tax=Pseudazoarcus pumilus TaxID=2067960 RepID=A0A2I6S4K8_9RHOO|nr:sensor histidine kinase [Pseudazoarcus pumilus]